MNALTPLQRMFLTGNDSLYSVLFMALMSDDMEEMDEAIDKVNDNPLFPETFRYGMEGLRWFRSYYKEHEDELSDEQKERVEDYDEEWTMYLSRQLHAISFEDNDRAASPSLEP